jgi:hypothetical protein
LRRFRNNCAEDTRTSTRDRTLQDRQTFSLRDSFTRTERSRADVFQDTSGAPPQVRHQWHTRVRLLRQGRVCHARGAIARAMTDRKMLWICGIVRLLDG